MRLSAEREMERRANQPRHKTDEELRRELKECRARLARWKPRESQALRDSLFRRIAEIEAKLK